MFMIDSRPTSFPLIITDLGADIQGGVKNWHNYFAYIEAKRSYYCICTHMCKTTAFLLEIFLVFMHIKS